MNDLPHTSHADQVVQLCREVFSQGDDFVQKITGSPSVDRPLQRIREFRNRPNPKVAVTVDMLSTGVDIPCLEFMVFMRPVKSRILWVQMLGRGTRRCPEIGKTHFTVFDCFNGTLIEYFKTLRISTSSRSPNRCRSPGHREHLPERRPRLPRPGAGEAASADREGHERRSREKFAAFIDDGDIGRFAGEFAARVKSDFIRTMKILRNADFQELLANYPRARRSSSRATRWSTRFPRRS